LRVLRQGLQRLKTVRFFSLLFSWPQTRTRDGSLRRHDFNVAKNPDARGQHLLQIAMCLRVDLGAGGRISSRLSLPGRIASLTHPGFRPNPPGPNVTKEMIDYNFLSFDWSRPKESPVGANPPTGLSFTTGCQLHALSAHLYIRKFARHARRHISAADPDARRQPLALVPPLTPMHATKEPQMFSIGKNTHVDSRTLQNKHWRERQSKFSGPRECRSNLARSPSIVPSAALGFSSLSRETWRLHRPTQKRVAPQFYWSINHA
jgi:hypothetical protein